MASPKRRVIAGHHIAMLYGHWGVNDPRGSGSIGFADPKYSLMVREGLRKAGL